jgi:serine/threonine-protein kinase
MDAERWQRLSPLLDALFDMDADTREGSLASLRADDPQLAQDLEALIALAESRDDFLSQPLVGPLPGMRPGVAVGPYRLERLLGEGGMGQVWLASRADGLYQRRVALKLLRPGLADPKLRLRFTRERQILARLEHPHIARLLDAGISEDQPYLALEYVDGEPLTDWCRANALTLDARLRVFLQVCEAVSHAHANLIVHRDLKPSNILVTALDEVRLLDFGIAKLLDTGQFDLEHTRTGLRTFTLHYAAPEQIRGEPVTTMTDVYSLGVVLYELLTDQRPYRLKRQTDAEWEEAILGVDPLRPSAALLRTDATTGKAAAGEAQSPRRRARALAGDLDNIVLKTLAKRPEQRYPSVEALALDLQRFREGKPVQARRQSAAYRLRKYGHRHRWSLATALLVAAVLSSALGIVAWQARQAVREAARAQALQDFMVSLFEHAGGAGDGKVDIGRLLDAGVQRGSTELARQPIARAELYGVIARLRLGMGDYRQALDLLQRQGTILDFLGDAAPVGLRIESATDRGRALRLLGDPAGCIATMRPLQALVASGQQQLPAQAAAFDSQLGRCSHDVGALNTAGTLFKRALALRRDPLDDAVGVAESLADMADLQRDQGDVDGALAGYRTALLELQSGAGPRHPLAIELLRGLCAAERGDGAIARAEAHCNRALALSLDLHGAQHPATIDASRQLAALHVDQGRLREAEAAYRGSRAWLVAHVGADTDNVAMDDNSLAIIAWERGDTAAALRALDQAIAIRRRGQRPLDLAGVLFNKAMVLADSGDADAARPLLLEARRLRGERLGAAHPLVGDTDRLLGEVDATLGLATARDELVRAVRLTRAGYGPDHAHTRRAELSLDRFDASHGSPDALVRLDGLAKTPADDIEQRKVVWLASASAAGLRCHGPQRAASLAQLQILGRALAAAQPEGGSIARNIDAIRRSCS